MTAHVRVAVVGSGFAGLGMAIRLHVRGAIRHLEERGGAAAAIEPRPEAQAAFVAGVDAMMRGSVWTAGGCVSWYLDRTGRNSTLWPGFIHTFRRRVGPFDAREYTEVA